MKRILFFVLFLCATCFFWQDLLGLLLKGALRVALKAQLAYRELHFANGQLVLEDAVLFDVSGGKSAYLLRADAVRLEWKKIRSFFIQLDNSCLTLSAEVFRRRWGSSSCFTYDIEATRGNIDWSDRFLPQAAFSYVDDQLHVSWENGATLSACKSLACVDISVADLPLQWFVQDSAGILSGDVQMALQTKAITLHMQGQDLLCDAGPFRYGGSVLLDWQSTDVSSLAATQWLRLSIEKGSVSQMVQEAKLLVTFQAGIGGKCEGTAITNNGLPLTLDGKAFDSDTFHSWGTAHFGEVESTITQIATDQWRVDWVGLGPHEVAFIQEIVAPLYPNIRLGNWEKGTAQGAFQFDLERRLQCETFQAHDLQVDTSDVDLVCKRLSFQKGDWHVEELRLKTCLPVEFHGNGTFAGDKGSLEGRLTDAPASEVRIFYERGNLFGSIGEFVFDGSLKQDRVTIPRFGGKLPAWIGQCERFASLGLTCGRISSLEEGFAASMDGDWSLACKLESCGIQTYKLADLHCELYANPSGMDLIAAEGVCEISFANRTFWAKATAPRIHLSENEALFDIRLTDQEWDFVRIAGTKTDGIFNIDPSRSSLLGVGLTAHGTPQDFHLNTTIPLRAFGSLLKRKGVSVPYGIELDGSIQVLVNTAPNFHVSLHGIGGQSIPFEAELFENNGVWNLSSGRLGPLSAQCQFSRKGEEWRVQQGMAHWKDSSVIQFEGKITDHIDAVIDHMKVDLAELGWPSLRGILEGKGRVAFTTQLEADFDANVTDLFWGEYGIENNGPLCFSIHSAGSALVKGVDCKIGARGLQAHLSADFLELDWKRHWLQAKKIRGVSPTNLIESPLFDKDREIVLFGDVQFSMDGADWGCELQEGFLPLAGGARHVKDFRISSRANTYAGSSRLIHQTNEALISWDIRDTLEGKILLQEVGKEQSMTLVGSYQNGLSLQSVEGSFGGITASFRATDPTHLIGSAQVHFTHLSEWIPAAVSEVFHDLEMGGGYELKGTVNVEDLSFEGLFCGKEIELFGYQLKTLMSQAKLSPRGVSLQDLLVSDEGGSLLIPTLLLNGEVDPWTMLIPTITIKELRPSLLHKPGEEKKELTPLVVRELTLRDFRGILEDGTTYRSEGELFFINSFKRGKSVFDLATHLFGRIVGLDLELLIPVEGKLLFELKGGFFNLTELQESYSEGRRSQFFLAEGEIPPRMSLRGDLEIFVRMKHFVLFALTEPFMISIDGKLSDPQFRLQKKKPL